MCTAVIFTLMTPVFYLITKYFYAEDLIDVIKAVESGDNIPQLDLERDIMTGVMMQFILTFLTLSIALFVMMKFITNRLWQPFDDTLKKAEKFNLAQNEIPHFNDTDVIEFERLNESLTILMAKNKDTYRIQKEFTENASHELQTPLAVTRSKLDLLMQEDLSEPQLELVSELYQLNTRMGHLNRNLLLLAKIENSQYQQQDKIPLTAFIENLIPSYNLLKGNCSVEFRHDNRNNTVITANPILLECLLNNLVVNAIRHTVSGDIIICITGDSSLEISNPAKGKPLNPEEIFRRFRSGDSGNVGTGLGLAIVKAICDFHGWNIEYKLAENRHIFTITMHDSLT